MHVPGDIEEEKETCLCRARDARHGLFDMIIRFEFDGWLPTYATLCRRGDGGGDGDLLK